MPPKKSTSPKKRTSKKAVASSKPAIQDEVLAVSVETIPEQPQEEIVITAVPPQPMVIEKHHVHLRQAVFLSIGFMVLFTSFLFVSMKMKAQDYSASVSAVVAPNEFNTRPPKQPTWWDKIDPLTKLYAGTGVVGAFVIGLGALTLLPKKPGKAGSGFAGKTTA